MRNVWGWEEPSRGTESSGGNAGQSEGLEAEGRREDKRA